MTRYYEVFKQQASHGAELNFWNRRMLVHLMAQAGFVNYEEVVAHYDLGIVAGQLTQTAIYGPIETGLKRRHADRTRHVRRRPKEKPRRR
jgi:hypothetical protein